MTTLSQKIQKAFAPEGPLASKIPGFRFREGQLAFAQAVGETITERSTVVVEAGTGTGKTFAYLIPALLANAQVLVSTASKTLQDQLFDKDIQIMMQALDRHVDVAVLKGRSNYICKQRLDMLVQRGELPERDSKARLDAIRIFSMQSVTGDKSDIDGIREQDPLWPLVTSTKDNCTGSRCPHYEDCFLTQARRRAQEADVVIVNHHLFLADLSLKDDSLGEILPQTDVVILDEAHKLPDIGLDYFSETLSLREFRDFAEEVRRNGIAFARESVDWEKVTKAILDDVLAIHDTLRLRCYVYDGEQKELAEIEGVSEALKEPFENLVAHLLSVNSILEQLFGVKEELDLLFEQSLDLISHARVWSTMIADPANVRDVGGIPSVLWLRMFEQNAIFSNTPLSLADSFAKARGNSPSAWIFTSATISTRDGTGQSDFRYFLDELGLPHETPTYTWGSPFDYEYQSRFYLPKGLPGVFDENFPEALVEATWPLLQKTRGKAFFLCTSFRMMERIAELLRQKMGASYTLCVQGESPKSELLERFKSVDNAVLVGSMSFWEGVDMKGDALQLVVIDKLPFAQFDTPLSRARKDWLTKQGKNPFMEHQLPEMITTLRQGVGRLIRSENDFGVIVMGDNRLLQKRYGRMVWDSLPPMIRTQDFARVYSFLDDPETAI